MIGNRKFYDVTLDKDIIGKIHLATGELLNPENYEPMQMTERMGESGIGVRLSWSGGKVASVCNYVAEVSEEKNKVLFAYQTISGNSETTVTDVKTGYTKKYKFVSLFVVDDFCVEELCDEQGQLVQKITTQYISQINSIVVENYKNGVKQEEIVTTRYYSNNWGKIMSESTLYRKAPNFMNENEYIITYNEHYANNKVKTSTDSNGIVTKCFYDVDGEVLERVEVYHTDEPNEKAVKYVNGEAESNEESPNSISYNPKGFIEKLESSDVSFKYEYDEWGRKAKIIVNDLFQPYVSFVYQAESEIVATYANGDVYKIITNKLGQPEKVQVNGKDRLIYHYDSSNNLTKIIDFVARQETLFDSDGNITKQGDVRVSQTISKIYNPYTVTKTVTYEFDGKQVVRSSVVNGQGQTISAGQEAATYDVLGRLKTLASPIGTKIVNYRTVNGVTNHFVESELNDGVLTEYKYGENGNIIEVKVGSVVKTTYDYDDFGRLKTENNNSIIYDANGNVTSKNGKVYVYNRDQLDGVDYDKLGNPLTHKGETCTWTNLRQLERIGNVGFRYSAGGLRLKKINGNKVTSYTWIGDKILAEKRSIVHSTLKIGSPIYNGGTQIYGNHVDIVYNYGVSGVIGFTLNGEQYWYQKNIMGDVLKIVKNNQVVAEYEYDAWGVCTIVSNIDGIAELNAIRYRSYYFDSETSLYYLKSRYYDAEMGRFINADDLSVLEESKEQINGLNLYAYCGNNPVKNVDSDGRSAVLIAWLLLSIFVIAPITVAVVDTVTGPSEGGTLDNLIKMINEPIIQPWNEFTTEDKGGKLIWLSLKILSISWAMFKLNPLLFIYHGYTLIKWFIG